MQNQYLPLEQSHSSSYFRAKKGPHEVLILGTMHSGDIQSFQNSQSKFFHDTEEMSRKSKPFVFCECELMLTQNYLDGKLMKKLQKI